MGEENISFTPGGSYSWSQNQIDMRKHRSLIACLWATHRQRFQGQSGGVKCVCHPERRGRGGRAEASKEKGGSSQEYGRLNVGKQNAYTDTMEQRENF